MNSVSAYVNDFAIKYIKIGAICEISFIFLVLNFFSSLLLAINITENKNTVNKANVNSIIVWIIICIRAQNIIQASGEARNFKKWGGP